MTRMLCTESICHLWKRERNWVPENKNSGPSWAGNQNQDLLITSQGLTPLYKPLRALSRGAEDILSVYRFQSNPTDSLSFLMWRSLADRVTGLGRMTVQVHYLSRYTNYPPPRSDSIIFNTDWTGSGFSEAQLSNRNHGPPISVFLSSGWERKSVGFGWDL